MKKKLFIALSTMALLVLGASSAGYNTEKELEHLYGPTPTEFTNDTKGAYLGVADGEDKIENDGTTPNPGEGEINPDEPFDPKPDGGGTTPEPDKPVSTMPTTLIIHYQMDPPIDYSDKEFYVWAGEKDGKSIEHQVDDFGMYVVINPADYGEHDTFNFIIKFKGTWAGQSTDTFIPYKDFKIDADGKLEVWCIPGDPGEIDVFGTIEETKGGKITYSKFVDWKTINVKVTEVPESYRLYAYNSQYYAYGPDDQKFLNENFLIDSNEVSEKDFNIKLPRYAPANLNFKVAVKFPDGRTKYKFVDSDQLYSSDRFNHFYTTDMELGAIYTKEKTTFRLWAPTAGRVELRVYENGTPTSIDVNIGSNFHKYYNMSYINGGVWSCEVEGDLHGKYYTYVVENTAGKKEVVDPYAHSAGVNGLRGMVLDFDRTNPEGWDDLPLVWDKHKFLDLKQPNDLSVYEIHVRDLTIDDTWIGEEKAGTFNAFAEKGTSYTEGDKTVSTGFDHIQELGVNAVQILPFFDSANNEIDADLTNNKFDGKYNWNYNPLNYNVVDGAFSSDPYDGAVRVKELKNLILALANSDNHVRVIMDVVYNHVASVASNNLNKIMPKYYFRINDEGFYTDGAGCGNEVKTEATMMRKFIVDSVKWWASEYKIKGFRFDLMGLIDTETMRQVKDAVYEIDPDNICYGEGWSLGYNGDAGTKGTESKEIFKQLGQTETSPGLLGGFSDTFRNNVRGGNDPGWGSTNSYPGWGLISQGSSDVGSKSRDVAEGMLGNFTWANGTNPYQTVNYASCHDNWTLYDQLHWTLSEDGGMTEPEFAIVAEGVLTVQSAVGFSNGIAFFNSGEELFRTKIDNHDYGEEPSYTELMYGQNVSHNSYKSSDETNSLKYDRKISIEYKGETIETGKYFEKYCEMIKMRNEMPHRLQPGQTAGEGKLGNAWYANDNADGSTGFAIYLGYEDIAYYMFFSGRVATSFGFGDFANCEEMYNSLGTGVGYQMNEKLDMSPRQFLILKKVNA